MGACSKTYDLARLYTRACSHFIPTQVHEQDQIDENCLCLGWGNLRGGRQGEETGETGEGEERKKDKEWEG